MSTKKAREALRYLLGQLLELSPGGASTDNEQAAHIVAAIDRLETVEILLLERAADHAEATGAYTLCELLRQQIEKLGES